MTILVCDINMFSMSQYAYVFEGDKTVGQVGPYTLDEIGPALVNYCKTRKIDMIRILDKAGYADNRLIPEMKEYALHNYENFDNIEIEVIKA